MEKEEYEATISAWADEAIGVIDAFQSLFPKTTEGTMKYLFTLHYMTMVECLKRDIPTDLFFQAITTAVASWHQAGKPEGVELLCINAAQLKTMVERMRAQKQGGGSKPSSDA